MARNATTAAKPVVAAPPAAAGAQSIAEQKALSVFTQERRQQMVLLGFDPETTPYDRESWISQIHGAFQVISNMSFRMGQVLGFMRKQESKEDFAKIIERVGITPDYAGRLMRLAVTFSPEEVHQQFAESVSARLLTAITQECTPDEIKSIVWGGSDALVPRDEVEQMSAQQLRNALRTERESRAKVELRHNGKIEDLSKKANKWDVSDARGKAALLMPDILKFGEQVKNGLHNLQHLLTRLDEAYKADKFTLDEDHRVTLDALFEQVTEQLDEAQKAI
jgi:hypothetical protein